MGTPKDWLASPDFDLDQRDDIERQRYEDEHKQADDRERADDINKTLNGGW